MNPVVKEDRLQIRVKPTEKLLLERAADAAHLSVSAFVLAAASERAETVLADRTIVRLSPKAAEGFVLAMDQPGEVNIRLSRALTRRRKFRFID